MAPKNLIVLMFFVLLAWSQDTNAQTTFSAISNFRLQGLQGDEISLAQHKGKKFLFYVSDANAPQLEKLNQLDSLAIAYNESLVVFVIPVSDFLGSTKFDSERWKQLRSASTSLFFMDIVKAQRKNGGAQHELLKWLSSKELNGHFDFDYSKAGQILMTNELGRMYACFQENVDFSNLAFKRALGTVR